MSVPGSGEVLDVLHSILVAEQRSTDDENKLVRNSIVYPCLSSNLNQESYECYCMN